VTAPDGDDGDQRRVRVEGEEDESDRCPPEGDEHRGVEGDTRDRRGQERRTLTSGQPPWRNERMAAADPPRNE